MPLHFLKIVPNVKKSLVKSIITFEFVKYSVPTSIAYIFICIPDLTKKTDTSRPLKQNFVEYLITKPSINQSYSHLSRASVHYQRNIRQLWHRNGLPESSAKVNCQINMFGSGKSIEIFKSESDYSPNGIGRWRDGQCCPK